MLRDCFASVELQNDHHAPALTGRAAGRCVFGRLYRSEALRHRRRLGLVEELTGELDHRSAAAIGKKAVVPDADKAAGKKGGGETKGETAGAKGGEETTEELDGAEGHDALLALVGIVLPQEGDLALLEAHETAIGDGDAVGVAREIPQHVLRTPERT